ncbi:MAG TPA: hypothetical protein VF541_06250 [Longimicrobium sp.]|jgi:hypothetical protein
MAFSQLRPLSFGEILDGAFTIYRRQFASLFLTALIPQLPVIAWTGLYALVLAGIGGGMPGSSTYSPGTGVLIAFAVLTLPAIVGGLTAVGGVTYQFSRAYTGQPVTTGDALKRGLRCSAPLFAAYALVGIMAMFGLLAFLIGFFVVLLASFAVAPAVVLERRGPVEGISRSWQLIKGAWGEVFLVVFVASLIAGLPASAVSGTVAIFGMIASHGDPGQAAAYQAAGQVLGGLLRTLTIPFSLGTTVLLYYDRRVRTEALDVQMMAESLSVPAAPYGAPAPYAETPAPAPRWG